MRHIAALLVVALLAAVVVFFAISPAHGWWLPAGASSIAHPIDALFDGILVVIAAGFVLVMALLSWAVWRGARSQPGRARTTHGHLGLELAWTASIGAVLVGIAFAQLPTWAALRDPRAMPEGGATAMVVAHQWAWRFAHAGDDGKLGTEDDLETASELVVPAGEPVLLTLRSRDVIHSFFVPELRIKQDVVPGRAISLWFTIERPGTYELVCAELCGFGHYAMAGRVRAVARTEYDAWIAERSRARLTNGAEDAR
ncbi:MAG: cytochrome c oxidase subunit II [Planctomycetota bacterium]|nr:cytochrome c oxidase subunit II [Planctomycetota bacterium]